MAKVEESTESRQSGRLSALEGELERYRLATEDALQQLDWCIGYFHGCGKRGIAKALSSNRSYIRRHLLERSEQPVPTEKAQTADE